MRSVPSTKVAASIGAGASHEIVFASAAERVSLAQELRAGGCAVIAVEFIPSQARGRLAQVLEEAAARGLKEDSAPGGELPARPFAGGTPVLAVMLPTLAPLAGPARTLDPLDCASLRDALAAWSEGTLLVLDPADKDLAGYAAPMPLASSLGIRRVSALAFRPLTEPLRRASASDDVGGDSSRGVEPDISRTGGSFERERERERDESWRRWTAELAAARGPQPLVTLERLFAESYVPLSNAVAAGLDDPHARAAHDEFRDAFTRSYTDAFPTFAATSKRPRMVLDAHDVAGRIARLHGARSTRLLLVDGMRFDLSRLILSRVSVKVGARAAVTDELVLWSALPTITMRQLETLARGVEALRAPDELEVDGEPPRGRTAEYVRRLRVGPREIHKLDIVEARLQSARGAALRMLPEIADQTADIIARHAESLPPHTLLFVFGDHGFTLERAGNARQGGASPEEVLVGAFALLVGDTH